MNEGNKSKEVALWKTLKREGYSEEDLDDIVQDAASDLATNANNGGIREQVNFLIVVCGWSEEDIYNRVKGS